MSCSFEVRNIVYIQNFSLLVVTTFSGLRLLKILIVDFLINIHVFNIIQVVAEILIDLVYRLSMMSLLDFRYLICLWYHLNL
jgi:type IV secretory pathway VirB6-like protein